MSDALYLSLWYPNLRLENVGEKIVQVLESFPRAGKEARVYAASVWPVGWGEPPVFQHVWGWGERGREARAAVSESLELLHEDYAYEFQIGWDLWELETAEGQQRWARGPHLARVTGFGPLFDGGCYEQEGHVRIDFGPDGPFLEESANLAETGTAKIEENLRQLVALAQAADKQSGASARLLWSELGEDLATRLSARLGMRN